MTEQVLDYENWQTEANAVINDVKDHLNNIELSKVLTSTDQHIYLNLTTKEDSCYCVELSGVGFRIVGFEYDKINLDNDDWFETPYSLFNKISPLFRESFGNALLMKLNNLNK